jgi:two-component system sensor histidine kinase KdpD
MVDAGKGRQRMAHSDTGRQRAGGSRAAVEYAVAITGVLLTTLLGVALRPYLNTIDMAMLFLLAVVIVAARTRLGPALVASALSIAAFNFMFVPPYFTFHVHDTDYILTFAVMLAVAALMSRLTARIRRQAEEAVMRAQAASTLSALDRELAGAGTSADLAAVAVRHLGQAAGGRVTLHMAGPFPEAEEPGEWLPAAAISDPSARVAALWSFQHGQMAGAGTDHCADAEVLVVPLRSAARVVGVAIVEPGEDEETVPERDLDLLAALGEQVAIALERAMLMTRHETARVEVEGERLRTALLSSLSHDLRTPLASIEGAASSLLQDGAGLPAEVRQDLTETILEESRRMTRLVANLLDMVRVEAGALAVRKQWQPLEESLGVALMRLEERLRHHPVEVDLPPDLPLVPIDELLVEQVFINLLENAAKYCPDGTPVTVTAARQGDDVVVTVSDRGPGIPVGAEEAVFEKFHRGGAPGTDGERQTSGAGLGLTICRGIVAAHGGRIWVEPAHGGGAMFRFTLPLQGPPLAPVPVEAAAAPDATGSRTG